MVILFVEQIRFAEKKKEGTLLPFRGRPVVPCSLTFQPQQVLVHTYIPRNKAPRGAGVWCGEVLSDSRGSWRRSLPCRLLPYPPDGYIIPQGVPAVNSYFYLLNE